MLIFDINWQKIEIKYAKLCGNKKMFVYLKL